MRPIYKYCCIIISCCSLVTVNGQVSTDRNYVIKNDIKQPGIITQSGVDALTVTGKVQQVGYFDGLGRPLQQVLTSGSPTGKDVITPVEFDNYGREVKKFLPYTSTGNAGSLRSNAYADQTTFYSTSNTSVNVARDNFPVVQAHMEFSPFSRPLENGAPGQTWQPGNGHTIKVLNSFNTAIDAVKRWKVNDGAAYTFGTYELHSTDYSVGELYKTISIDEHGKQVIEFKDKEGKIILKKVQVSATPDNIYGNNHSNWICTYYIYDDFNRLRCVIQPKAIEYFLTYGWSLTSDHYNELCFRYEYDAKGRMIMKKVPGAAKVEMVYDARDRLIMTRDGNLIAAGYWMVNVYDNLNRPIKTGLLTNNSSAETHAASAASSTTYPSTSGNFDILTETGYDTYNGLPQGSPSSSLDNTNINGFNFFTSSSSPEYAVPLPSTSSSNIKGMTTWTKVKVIGTSSDYLYTVTIYDDNGRVIQVKSTNTSGGTDVVSTQYDFTGKVLRNHVAHVKSGIGAQTHGVLTKMTYDDIGRLLAVKKTISSSVNSSSISVAEKTIVTNEYDELGQLKNKKLGVNPTNTSLPLETMTYDYNIRSWMVGANRDYAKSSSNTNNYFGFDLGYDQTISTYASAQYNGNIGGTVWKTKGDNEVRKYDFSYDAVNRLIAADFNQYTSGSYSKSAGVDFSVSGLSYDANGNISGMSQKGLKLNSSTFIDQLSYSYSSSGNKLQAVTDGSNDNGSKLGDFKYDANTKGTTDYTYDVNGNMTADANKKISSITYNHLNLPSSITVTGKGSIAYTYDAAGNKLKKVTTEGSTVTTTEYMFGTYVNNVLQFLPQEEGRIRFEQANTNNCPATSNRFVYDYFLKDHLGNVRMVLTEQNENLCYPGATVEDSRVANEKLFYDIADARCISKSSTAASSINSFEDKIYRTHGGLSGEKTGLGITLKVMSGDKVKIAAESYYTLPSGGAGQPWTMAVTELLGSLTGSNTVTVAKGTISPSDVTGIANNSTNLSNFISNNNNNNSTTAKAYVNWILFDDQLKYISAGADPVQTNGGYKFHDVYINTPVTVSKSGYLYVFVSNESNLPVYFDNLLVTHTKGPIVEETHYYPFGLTMAGISSKAAGGVQNRLKYNDGTELQSAEFSDGSGLELYATHFRSLDPQLGRLWQIDPLDGLSHSSSLYAYANNNPIRFNDPMGLTPETPIPETSTPEKPKVLETVVVTSRPKPKEYFNWAGFREATPKQIKQEKSDNLLARVRLRDNLPLVQGGESENYLSKLEWYKKLHQNDKEWRQMSIGALVAIAAPILITIAPEVAASLKILSGQISSGYLDASLIAHFEGNMALHAIKNKLLGGIMDAVIAKLGTDALYSKTLWKASGEMKEYRQIIDGKTLSKAIEKLAKMMDKYYKH